MITAPEKKRFVPKNDVELVAAQDLPMPPMLHLVSSIVVEQRGGHDHVTLWSRGGCAGLLVLNVGDGAALARALDLVEEP